MSARPLQKLPSIRLKLGSTIVFAVGLTLALVYVFLGFALQNASRDADYVRLVRVADRAAASSTPSIPPGVTVLLYRDGSFVSTSGRSEATSTRPCRRRRPARARFPTR